MSDQNQDTSEPPIQPDGQLYHFAPARIAQLLFGEGQDGWRKNWAGQYLRSIDAPIGRLFTREEFDGCLKLLRDEFDIDDVSADFDPLHMSFCIDAEDMGLLRQDGLGITTIGKLAAYDSPLIVQNTKPLDKDQLKNRLLATLKENLRLAVHERQHWKGTLKHPLISGDQRECTIFLSNTFLMQLEQVLPKRSGVEYGLKESIRDILPTLLPHIPVTITLLGEDNTPSKMLTLAVKPEYYAALDEAIMESKQTPRTNVTSIMPAIEKRETGMKR